MIINLDNLTKLTINPFPIIAESLDSKIEQNKHTIGMSEIGYCKKKIILRHIHNKYDPTTMRTLAGTIVHKLIEYKPTRTKIVDHINKQLNIDTFPLSQPEQEAEIDLGNGYKLRLHPDILTPHYVVEIKTTARPTRQWTKDVAPYHITQCNGYCGHYERKLGIILLINLNFFLSASKNWEYLLDKYTFTYPFTFDEKLYEQTLERSKNIAECIEYEIIDTYGDPELTWECAECNVIEECGRTVYKCQHTNQEGRKCNKVMCEYTDLLSRGFQEQPICENHSRRKDYFKWKYKVIE